MANSSSKSSTWGSFLQQAVAGVEARLDTILADEQCKTAKEATKSSQPQGLSHIDTINCNDQATNRLQKRLQQAVTATGKGHRILVSSTSPPSNYPDGTNDSVGAINNSLESSAPPKITFFDASRITRSQNDLSDPIPQAFVAEQTIPTMNTKIITHEPVLNASTFISPNPIISPLVSSGSHHLPAGTAHSKSEDLEPKRLAGNSQYMASALVAETDRLQSALKEEKCEVASLRTEFAQDLARLNDTGSITSDHIQYEEKIAELEEEVAFLQAKKTLDKDQAKDQIAEFRELAEKANTRAIVAEVESRAKILAMETKLETMKAQSEKTSPISSNESVAKLMRQLDNLQAQYFVASENWQGIETTLLSQINALEAERDEAQRKASDMRRKAKEAMTESKQFQEELEKMQNASLSIDTLRTQHARDLAEITARAEAAEASFADTMAELKWYRQYVKKSQDECCGWLEKLPGLQKGYENRSLPPQLPLSRCPLNSDQVEIIDVSQQTRELPFSSSNSEGTRRSNSSASIQAVVSSTAVQTSPRYDCASQYNTIFAKTEAPLAETLEKDEILETFEAPASSLHATQEAVSTSTGITGPSVQMVERMSAAIRRLESEKVAARQELFRILYQRDEARGEIVTLMKQVEDGQTASRKAAELETQLADLNQRHQTTLELLGEKSELVEELQADIVDVKQMYRELVERTVTE